MDTYLGPARTNATDNLRISVFDATDGSRSYMTRDEFLQADDTEGWSFGDADDVVFAWDGTNLEILPATDDTGAVHFGDGTTDIDVKFFLGAAGDSFAFDVGAKALILDGDARIDLSQATGAAGNTDGFVIKAGTSGSRVVEDTASGKFMSFYWDCGATSGDTQGIYNRLYITGAGGGGESLRAFTTVENVAGATARGAHISLNFGASGNITGLGTALETTLHLPDGGTQAGTLSSLKVAIHADGTSSDPAGATALAFFNVVAQGDGTGLANVDDDAYLFDVDGLTGASGTAHLLSTTSLAELPASSIGLRCSVLGTDYYLPLVAASEWN